MKIETVMIKAIVTVEMDDSLKTVKEIFDNTHFHNLLVIESGKLFGIISKTDLYKSLSPNIGTISETVSDAAALNKKVHQIMTRKPQSLKPGADVYDAVEIFNNNEFSCIPVINDENKPVGIITIRDILRIIGQRKENH